MGRPRKSSGYISLDLKDKSSKRSVKVFFVPARAGATGTFLKGVRVQFFLGFTQETGYEAYEVRTVSYTHLTLPTMAVV